jgi:hypothetical protein
MVGGNNVQMHYLAALRFADGQAPLREQLSMNFG